MLVDVVTEVVDTPLGLEGVGRANLEAMCVDLGDLDDLGGAGVSVEQNAHAFLGEGTGLGLGEVRAPGVLTEDLAEVLSEAREQEVALPRGAVEVDGLELGRAVRVASDER